MGDKKETKGAATEEEKQTLRAEMMKIIEELRALGDE